MAAKQLALTEESYRALVSRFAGGRSESAGEMQPAERRAIIDHFRKLGFKPKSAGATRGPRTAAARRLDERPQARKLRALWLALWQLGHVGEPGEGALAAFLKRHTGLEALQFADAADLDKAIEHLKGWCARVGYRPQRYRSELHAAQQGSYKPGLIEAQWARLAALNAFRYGVLADLGTWLVRNYGVAAPAFLKNPEAENAIDQLGQWIRKLKPAGGDPSTGAQEAE